MKISPESISEALPDLKKADKLLTDYITEREKPLGKFKPENYLNNTKYKFTNVKTDEIRAVLRALKKRKKEKCFCEFADYLMGTGYFAKIQLATEMYAFCDLTFERHAKVVPYIDNWAHNDSFTTRVTGPYLLKHPEELGKLIPFAKSKRNWDRRFASVSLISTLKDSELDHSKALEILDILMVDSDPEVMKTTDWMIRVLLTKKSYVEGFAYMKKWADYYRKKGDRNVRWVLVRARHKLLDKEKKEIEKMICF